MVHLFLCQCDDFSQKSVRLIEVTKLSAASSFPKYSESYLNTDESKIDRVKLIIRHQ